MRTTAVHGHHLDSTTEQLAAELSALEGALDAGDLATARRLAQAMRQAIDLTDEPPVPQRPHLRLVESVALTGREFATLGWLTDGSMSQKDIAREMGVTPNTVKTHLKSLYLKLDAHCRGEAIERARDLGILRRAPSGAISTRPALDAALR